MAEYVGEELRKMAMYQKLTRVRLERFTAFLDLDLEFSPGINVFVGANGTGKTHLLKVCYAACALRKEDSFAEKLCWGIPSVWPCYWEVGQASTGRRQRCRGGL